MQVVKFIKLGQDKLGQGGRTIIKQENRVGMAGNRRTKRGPTATPLSPEHKQKTVSNIQRTDTET